MVQTHQTKHKQVTSDNETQSGCAGFPTVAAGSDPARVTTFEPKLAREKGEKTVCANVLFLELKGPGTL